MALDISLTASLVGTHTNPLDLVEGKAAVSISHTVQLTNGTGAGQANQIFTDQRTLAASGTESLDLAGSLTNAFGATLTFTKIKAVYIKAAAGNTNNVRVTRPASNGLPLFLGASDGLDVLPGGVFFWACSDDTAVAVTGGSGDLLTLTNSSSGSSVTYDIAIVGVA